MFVAVMAFFAQISDPVVGGTYMTLLNTLANLGGNWPSTLALRMVDPLTSKLCTSSNGTLFDNDCSTSSLTEVSLLNAVVYLMLYLMPILCSYCVSYSIIRKQGMICDVLLRVGQIRTLLILNHITYYMVRNNLVHIPPSPAPQI